MTKIWMNASKADRRTIVTTLVLFAFAGIWLWLTPHFAWPHKINDVLEGPQRGSIYNPAYGAYFALMGGVSAALWIASFAVLALYRYQSSTTTRKRFMLRIANLRVQLFNVWVLYHVSYADAFFIAAFCYSAALLIPAINPTLLIGATLLVMALIILSTRNSARHVRETHERIAAMHAACTARFLRLRSWRSRYDDRHPEPSEGGRIARDQRAGLAERIRSESLKEVKGYDREIRVLHLAMTRNAGGFAEIAAPILTLLAVDMFPRNATAAVAIAALTLAGLVRLFRVAVTLYVHIPEAVAGVG